MTAWLKLLGAAGVAITAPAFASAYLTVAQAQAAIFPGAVLSAVPVTLTREQMDAIAAASGVRPLSPKLNVWQVAGGGWFIVDQVIGKHDLITYALGIGPDGTVRGVEILDYREAYGGEVRMSSWRAQFRGKTVLSPLSPGRDIRTISGATLSSRHVTEGVRRLLVTHRLALAAK